MQNSKKALEALVYTLLVVFAIITLIPFAHMLAGALKTKFDYAATLFLPEGDRLGSNHIGQLCSLV